MKKLKYQEGRLYIEKGYGDIDIHVSFNFVSKSPGKMDKDFRIMKSWLLQS